jgi:small GTP-binding protein
MAAPSGSPTRKVEFSAKLVLLGESAVGKSSIALRFVRREFVPNQEATIGAAFLARSVSVPTGNVKLEIWDTAGQERYRSLAPMYYRGAAGALVVFDITSSDSLRKALTWIRELRTSGDPNIAVVLVGNKCDLDSMRQVPTHEAEAIAAEENVLFFEASAKDGTNIDEIFSSLASRVISSGAAAAASAATRAPIRGLEPPGARRKNQQGKGDEKKECQC